MIVLGRLALILALVFSLAGIAFITLGVRQRSRQLIRNGYVAVYLFFLSVTVAVGVLLQAFLAKDLSFAYVAENTDVTLSTFYRIAGFWAGQAGSFLLWLGLLALVTAIIVLRDSQLADRLTATAVAVLCAVSAFFAVLMVADSGSNPFVRAEAGSVGQGLNPLLLHPAMVLHPPALFAGYVGLAVPFAFAIAALILGDSGREWVQRSDKWAVGGWAFLSLGIGLGAWWAYVVLSWGGYWGWDPVENTSLVPWLTATALLHSMTLYRRRGIFKHATLGLAAVTFWFTILATWVTRTGLITSVHAFGRNKTLIEILSTLLGVVAVATVGLIVWRWRRFESDGPRGIDEGSSLASRDFLYYLTSLILAVLAVAVALATVVMPLVFHKTVGPESYQRIAEPLGVIVLAGIAVCPLLSWRRTEGKTFFNNVVAPLVVTAVALPLLLLGGEWRAKPFGLVGLLVCVFAGAAVLQFIVVSTRRRGRWGGVLTVMLIAIGLLIAFGLPVSWGIVAGIIAIGVWVLAFFTQTDGGQRRAALGSPTRLAAFVAHFGVVLILAGLIGSNIYKHEVSTYLAAKPGQQAAIDGYTLRFANYRQDTGPQSAQRFYAVFDVLKGGKQIGTLEPHTDIFPGPTGAASRAVILHLPTRDLFVVGQDPFDNSSTNLRLQLDIFPLVRLVWVGSLLLVVGATVSLLPLPQRATVRVAADDRVVAEGGAA